MSLFRAKLPPNAEMWLNVRLLPVLTLLSAVLFLISPYRGFTVLLIGLGGLWLIGFVWTRALALGLSLQREVRYGWAQVGDRLEERFTVLNDSIFPASWVRIGDDSDLPGHRVSQVRYAGPLSQTQWRVSSVCGRRGLYTLGPTRLETGDPFGVYTLCLEDPSTATLMVTPPVVPLPTIQIAPGGRVGGEIPRVDAPERTVSAVSVREYIPGDSLRWIHWPTSARRGDLYVRIFEGAPAGDWWILLDLNEDVQAGDGADSTLEHGVILAASLADQGIRDGRSVGVVASSGTGMDERLLWLPPRMSDDQRWEILRGLALVEPGERPLSDLLDIARPSLRQRTSLIVITPSVEGAWPEALLAYRRRGIVPTVLLFDPHTFGAPQTTDKLDAALSHLGIAHEIISSDLLDQSETQPGRAGHWEWRVTPLGRAVPVDQPADLSWRDLDQAQR
jgi:uncharacterized protein (DUF58 family)